MKNREIIALIASIGVACPLLAACWSLNAVDCPQTAGKITCYGKMEVLELSAGTVYQLPSTKLANTMRTSWTGQDGAKYACSYVTDSTCRKEAYPNAVLIGSSCKRW